jgi:hypothetical protein
MNEVMSDDLGRVPVRRASRDAFWMGSMKAVSPRSGSTSPNKADRTLAVPNSYANQWKSLCYLCGGNNYKRDNRRWKLFGGTFRPRDSIARNLKVLFLMLTLFNSHTSVELALCDV